MDALKTCGNCRQFSPRCQGFCEHPAIMGRVPAEQPGCGLHLLKEPPKSKTHLDALDEALEMLRKTAEAVSGTKVEFIIGYTSSGYHLKLVYYIPGKGWQGLDDTGPSISEILRRKGRNAKQADTNP